MSSYTASRTSVTFPETRNLELIEERVEQDDAAVNTHSTTEDGREYWTQLYSVIPDHDSPGHCQP